RLLAASADDGAVPVFGEANTVQWMLKSGLGKTVDAADEQGRPVRLRIVGLLKDSVFQSELVMAEGPFLRLFPRQEGYTLFLIAPPADQAAAARDLLETTW